MIRGAVFIIPTHGHVMHAHLRVSTKRREWVIHISPMADTGSARTVHRSRDKLTCLYFHHTNFMFAGTANRQALGRT